jgi:NAD+ kinase
MMRILTEIADRVSEAIDLIPDPHYRGQEICMGADGTPTSQIDKVAENTVLDYIIRNEVPLNVLSEEIGFVDNGAEETLVLDPIDGTTNSTIGVPMYTISMAVGRRALSDVHTAYIRNLVTGDEYTAEKGRGAFKNGHPIKAIQTSDLSQLIMAIYLGNGANPDSFTLAKRIKSSRAYGCASLEMALVAEGMLDGFVMNSEDYRRSIRVVDIAASYLILKEAGGHIYDLDGTQFDMPFDLCHHSDFIAVGDPKVYDFIMNDNSREISSGKKVSYGIYANVNIPNVVDHVRRVVAALGDESYVMDTEIASVLGVDGMPLSEIGADVVIVIGGDGTILRSLQQTDAMIVGVNAGGIGFLADIDLAHIEDGIARLRRGEYKIQKRFRLRSCYEGQYLSEATNEAVLHTDTVAKIRHFRIYVNDALATEVRADGVIVSTSTGSTGYAMSLGAPMIDPNVKAMAIVPMAAFKFASRPIIVPSSAKITIEQLLDKGCVLVVDGQKEYPVAGKTKVEFTMSPTYSRFITFDTDFYSRVRNKLENAI